MNKPYPGISPNYTHYSQTGGYNREIFVVEMLCLESLSLEAKCLIREKIEALVFSLSNSMGIEKSQVAISEQFDTILRKALRIE